MRMTSAVVFAVLATAMSVPAWGQILTVYSNDFDSPPVVAGGVSASLTGGGDVASIAPYNATYGNFRRNDSNTVFTEVSLSNLPVHTGVDIDFIMAFLESWDSLDGSCCSPDNLDLYVDGSPFASYTYNNALGTIKDFDGGTVIYEYVPFDSNSYFSDSVADMYGDPALSFAHSGSTLKVSWIASGAGWQGSADEAYGIDNLKITLDGVVVPEPSGLLLVLAAAFAIVDFSRRNRGNR